MYFLSGFINLKLTNLVKMRWVYWIYLNSSNKNNKRLDIFHFVIERGIMNQDNIPIYPPIPGKYDSRHPYVVDMDSEHGIDAQRKSSGEQRCGRKGSTRFLPLFSYEVEVHGTINDDPTLHVDVVVHGC